MKPAPAKSQSTTPEQGAFVYANAVPLVPDFAANELSAPLTPSAKGLPDFSGAAAARWVWRGQHSLGKAAVLSSGFEPIDAHLPGGGWPLNTLNEWLIPSPGHGEWTLLKPLLACISRRAQPILLIDPPHMPYAPALVQAGVDLHQLIIVKAGTVPGKSKQQPALWAAEQALRSGCAGAVIVFSKSADQSSLRRVKVACEAHAGLCVMVRAASCAAEASPASVRVQLRAEATGLRLQFLKLHGRSAGQYMTVQHG